MRPARIPGALSVARMDQMVVAPASGQKWDRAGITNFAGAIVVIRATLERMEVKLLLAKAAGAMTDRGVNKDGAHLARPYPA